MVLVERVLRLELVEDLISGGVAEAGEDLIDHLGEGLVDF